MSKVITSPVKRWAGTVTLSDPLTYPQHFAFEDALDAARRVAAEAKERGEEPDSRRINYAYLPGVCKCVEAWDLKGLAAQLDADTFPVTPSVSAARLAAWLINEVVALYQEAEELPNG